MANCIGKRQLALDVVPGEENGEEEGSRGRGDKGCRWWRGFVVWLPLRVRMQQGYDREREWRRGGKGLI